MKKIILSVALVAMLALAGVAHGAFSALEEQGNLSTTETAVGSQFALANFPAPGGAAVTTGDEAGEARYRENDLNNAGDTTNRRELRVRGEDMIVIDLIVAGCGGVPSICTISQSQTHPAADGDLYKVYIAGNGHNGYVRNAANTADATVPAEAGRVELRGRSEQGKPDPDITLPNLDADPNGHLVQWVDKHGLVVESGVINQ